MIRQRLWAWQSRWAPYLFLAPMVILFLVFLAYPLLWSVLLSGYKYATPRSSQYVGTGQFAYALTDRLFWLAVLNTLTYTVAIVGLQIPASLGLAMLLNSRWVRARSLFRFAFFSSHVVGHVFVAVIFRMIMAQRHGLVPRALGLLNVQWTEINWLGDPLFARIAIVLAVFWVNIGWGMIYFLAALQNVDPELYDASQVDGAGRWGRFWHVTLPGIRPVMLFMVVVCTIGSLQIFELPYMLFDNNAGPGLAGLTIVMYLYMTGFDFGDIGAASAVGWLLACLIFGIAMLQLKVTRATSES